jgi:uncharacterized repeat protein (TIGR01451 family)
MNKMFLFKPLPRLLPALLMLCFSIQAWALSTNQVNVSQKTGPYFILDHNKPATGPRAGFVAIEITNTSNQPISNFKIMLTTIVGTGFSFGIGEDSSRVFLSIQPGEKVLASFFIRYPSTFNTIGRFQFQLQDKNPGLVTYSTSISTKAFISASSGGIVNSRKTSSSKPVGEYWTDTIRYHFGNVLCQDAFFFQPVSNATYNASGMFLVGNEVIYSDVPGIQVGAKNLFCDTATANNHGSNKAVIVVNKYIVRNVNTPILIQPVCATLSGNHFKYQFKWSSNPLNNQSCAGNPSKLTISKSVNNAFPKFGDTLIYTVVLKNTSNGFSTVPELNDELPEGYTFLSVSSTSRINAENSCEIPKKGSQKKIRVRGARPEGYGISSGDSLTFQYLVIAPLSDADGYPDTNFVSFTNGLYTSPKVFSVVKLNSGLLPITDLAASIKNNQLTWSVKGTAKDAVFQIEGGENTWSPIALVSYQYGKRNYSMPLYNAISYPFIRISVVENGQITLSTIIRNTSLPEQAFSVFPQPFTHSVQLTLPKNVSQTAKLEVYDSQGRWISSSSTLNQLEVSTENWPTGVYFFYLIENGQRQIFKGIKIAH